MKIEQLRRGSPKSCETGNTLRESAQLIRDLDCGCLPVTARGQPACARGVRREPHSTAPMLSPLSILGIA